MRHQLYTSLVSLILLVIVFSCQRSDQATGGQKFGGEITLTDAVTLAAVYETPERYEGREILLQGKITQVCQTKGCWMKLTDGDRELIVRFKDYGFFVPKDAASSTVTIQGIFSTETDKHVQEEAHAQEKGEIAEHHAGEHGEHEQNKSSQSKEMEEKSTVHADEGMPYSFTASAVVIYPPSSTDI